MMSGFGAMETPAPDDGRVPSDARFAQPPYGYFREPSAPPAMQQFPPQSQSQPPLQPAYVDSDSVYPPADGASGWNRGHQDATAASGGGFGYPYAQPADGYLGARQHGPPQPQPQPQQQQYQYQPQYQHHQQQQQQQQQQQREPEFEPEPSFARFDDLPGRSDVVHQRAAHSPELVRHIRPHSARRIPRRDKASETHVGDDGGGGAGRSERDRRPTASTSAVSKPSRHRAALPHDAAMRRGGEGAGAGDRAGMAPETRGDKVGLRAGRDTTRSPGRANAGDAEGRRGGSGLRRIVSSASASPSPSSSSSPSRSESDDARSASDGEDGPGVTLPSPRDFYRHNEEDDDEDDDGDSEGSEEDRSAKADGNPRRGTGSPRRIATKRAGETRQTVGPPDPIGDAAEQSLRAQMDTLQNSLTAAVLATQAAVQKLIERCERLERNARRERRRARENTSASLEAAIDGLRRDLMEHVVALRNSVRWFWGRVVGRLDGDRGTELYPYLPGVDQPNERTIMAVPHGSWLRLSYPMVRARDNAGREYVWVRCQAIHPHRAQFVNYWAKSHDEETGERLVDDFCLRVPDAPPPTDVAPPSCGHGEAGTEGGCPGGTARPAAAAVSASGGGADRGGDSHTPLHIGRDASATGAASSSEEGDEDSDSGESD